MKSGIYIDDQFVGITWHTVNVYFDVLRKAVDSGEGVRFTIPGEEGMMSFLITPNTRLRSFVDYSEADELFAETVAEHPFGNFPVLARKFLDDDSRYWELVNATLLGDAIKKLDDPIETP